MPAKKKTSAKGPGSNQHQDKPAVAKTGTPVAAGMQQAAGTVAAAPPVTQTAGTSPSPPPPGTPVAAGAKLVHMTARTVGGKRGGHLARLAKVVEGETVWVVPDPSNPHDPFAQKIWSRFGPLGHLPASHAVRSRNPGPVEATIAKVVNGPVDDDEAVACGLTPTDDMSRDSQGRLWMPVSADIDVELPLVRAVPDEQADQLREARKAAMAEKQTRLDSYYDSDG